VERFFAPFHELASGLVLPAPGPAGQPLSEPEFEQRVADISAEILALCVKACVIVMPPGEAVVEA
jgi:hypothetical protein